MTRIRTPRVLLRPAVKADLGPLHHVFSNSDAMRYWDRLPHTHAAQTAGFIDNMMATPGSQGEDFVVEFEDKVIGKAGFWKFPDIGFIFHPDYWGMGLAREAVAALVDYGFQERRLPAISADVDPRNTRSIRLLEALGFTETHREARTIKVGDHWCDSVYFILEARGADQTDDETVRRTT